MEIEKEKEREKEDPTLTDIVDRRSRDTFEEMSNEY